MPRPQANSQHTKTYCCYSITMMGGRKKMQRLQRGLGDPSAVRPLLVLLSVVLMVIVGLLGMHTLSAGSANHGASTAGHGKTTLIDAPASSEHLGAGTSSSANANSATCDDICQKSASQPLQHTDMMMACALALIVSLIFLLPIAAMYRIRIDQGQPRFLGRQLKHPSMRPRPPSLIVLSISRT